MKSKALKFIVISSSLLIPFTPILAAKDAPKAPVAEELTSDSLTKANAALENSYGEKKEKVNIAVDAKSAAGKAIEAAKEKVSAITPNPAWAGLEPKIEIGKWGQEIRIIVKPSKSMKPDSLLAIKSVKLETPQGEFLGLKTYAAEEKTRDAEFMVNPELLKIDAVKITIASGTIGEYATISSLAPNEPEVKKEESVAVATKEVEKTLPVQAAEQATEAVAQVKTQEAPKKKKGWW